MKRAPKTTIRIGSRLVSSLLLILAYTFAIYAAPIVFGGGDTAPGYRYLLLLTATLLLLAAHGFGLIRRSQIRRLDSRGGGVKDVSTDVTLSVWEIFFGWLGVASALVCLYYAAPVTGLAEWHPRIFLCVVVFLGATYQRALVFFYSTLPFVLTITVLDVWSGWSVSSSGESWAKIGLIALDLALLVWAARLTRMHGVFTVSELELPVGPGKIGGRLCGVIRSQQQAIPRGGYQLDLSCIRQFREEAGRSSGEVLFHFRKLVRGDLPGARFSGSSVPVEFDLPEIALASASAGGARIAWTLRATAQLPEADFGCAFEAPVEESSGHSDRQGNWSVAEFSGAQPPVAPKLEMHADSSVGFQDQARPNAASELVALACLLFWFQMMWLATASGSDWATWAMFAAGLAFLGVLLAPWAVRREVGIGDGLLTVVKKSPIGSQKESYHLDDIETVEVVPADYRSGLVDATQYYKIVLTTIAARKAVLLSHFRERRLAEAVAEQISEQAGHAAAQPAPALQAR